MLQTWARFMVVMIAIAAVPRAARAEYSYCDCIAGMGWRCVTVLSPRGQCAPTMFCDGAACVRDCETGTESCVFAICGGMTATDACAATDEEVVSCCPAADCVGDTTRMFCACGGSSPVCAADIDGGAVDADSGPVTRDGAAMPMDGAPVPTEDARGRYRGSTCAVARAAGLDAAPAPPAWIAAPLLAWVARRGRDRRRA